MVAAWCDAEFLTMVTGAAQTHDSSCSADAGAVGRRHRRVRDASIVCVRPSAAADRRIRRRRKFVRRK